MPVGLGARVVGAL